MIRREIKRENGDPAWLLVSQVEHARISGEISRAWSEPFPEEVLAAIAHHDDGWAAWEAEPQIDPQHGRPFSFMEMPLADSLTIWSRSIASAHLRGPLAGAIVAGHFIGLASGSEQAADPLAHDWICDMTNQRADWLAEWRRGSLSHTLPLAEHGQQMLLTADLLSLWLCCDGPVASKSETHSNAEMKTRSAAVLGTYQFFTQDRSAHDAEIVWQGSIAPWPFVSKELSLAAGAIAARAGNYRSWQEIAEASWPVHLRWRLSRIEC